MGFDVEYFVKWFELSNLYDRFTYNIDIIDVDPQTFQIYMIDSELCTIAFVFQVVSITFKSI